MVDNERGELLHKRSLEGVCFLTGAETTRPISFDLLKQQSSNCSETKSTQAESTICLAENTTALPAQLRLEHINHICHLRGITGRALDKQGALQRAKHCTSHLRL